MPQVTEFRASDANWQAYIDHLNRVKMLNESTRHSEAKPNCYYLGVMVDQAVVGHLALRRQPVTIPASVLNANQQTPLTNSAGDSLTELFVLSFAVEPDYRRHGYGRALQEAGLQKARDLKCYQMRSWSSADSQANYALKISMGFAIQPALYPMPGGSPISGAYFIKQLTH